MWVPLSLTCNIKEHTQSLSICWWLLGKKSEGEDKVENGAKQKDRWEQKINTRFEYRK